MRSRMGRMLWFAPLAIVGFAAFIALGGYVVRELWNWLTPSLFGWKAITFLQAVGLLALSRILFGGFGMHGSRPSPIRRRIAERMDQRLEERLASMTPEERERLREGLRRHAGGDPGPGEGGH